MEESKPRLASLDALRGFTMFWIMGGDSFVPYLGTALWPASSRFLWTQLDHVTWEGFVFYDLIFPLFLFMAGASMPFSLGRQMEEGQARGMLAWKVLRRSVLLLLLGIVYNGFFSAHGWGEVRWMGVLQRIGLCYLAAGLLMLTTGIVTRIVLAFGLLLAYWAALAWIPVPDFDLGTLSPEGNLASYVDRLWLPGTFCCFDLGDNEGILSTVPAVSTILFGTFAGDCLRRNSSPGAKVLGLGAMGLALAGLGLAWSHWLPLIKNLWTPSFACLAAGYSFLLLGLFYWILDLKGWKAWAFPLVLIGLNPITIYMAQNFVDFGGASAYWLSRPAGSLGAFGPVLVNGVELGMKFSLLWVLFKKKIFLRL